MTRLPRPARRRHARIGRIARTPSPQTLTLDDRRVVAVWAADCADAVVHLFEAQAPDDTRPRAAIDGCRAFAAGHLTVGAARTLAFAAHAAARAVADPAAVAAARSAGQGVSTAHMGAHALGAAAYAARAAGLAATAEQDAVAMQIERQLLRLSAEARRALRRLPPVGANRQGPLSPTGLLGRPTLAAIVAELQRRIGAGDGATGDRSDRNRS